MRHREEQWFVYTTVHGIWLQGFGSVAVGAPFAVVPPSSTLVYDVELLRLSTIGPDALTRVCPNPYQVTPPIRALTHSIQT